MMWARKDKKWNPTREKLEAKYDEMDADGNGRLTADEKE
jgi:hypothetical protein